MLIGELKLLMTFGSMYLVEIVLIIMEELFEVMFILVRIITMPVGMDLP